MNNKKKDKKITPPPPKQAKKSSKYQEKVKLDTNFNELLNLAIHSTKK